MAYNPLKRGKRLVGTSGVLLIITAAVLLELIAIVQYKYSHDEITKNLRLRAESELRAKDLAIQNILKQVETAVENHVWDAERLLACPDSSYAVTRRLVKQNSNIIGSSLSFIPNYYSSEGYWFESYAVRRENGAIETMQLGSAEHDYTGMEFFEVPVKTDRARWSNPYLDSDGARMLLTTYSEPVHDVSGRLVAVLNADVSLDWLDNILSMQYVSPSSYHILMSRTGQLMSYPDKGKVMRSTFEEVVSEMKDTLLLDINRRMLAGESGMETVSDARGGRYYVFYSPVGGNTGWSLAVVSSENEVFGEYERMRTRFLWLRIVGIVILGFIVFRFVRNVGRLQKITVERERIGSELSIARNIQMGMLPKGGIFKGSGEMLEIEGLLVPALEVGGDLYDYYVKDNRLYFCIGDVSGKGVPAALLMTVTRSLFRSVSTYASGAAKTVEYMNLSMSDMNDSNMFVTLFVGVLDLISGKLDYCNAGHGAPVLIGKEVSRLDVVPNLPLGVYPDFKYQGQEAVLPPDCTLFVYTDGLTEAKNMEYAEFGEENMIRTLEKIKGNGLLPAELLEYMVGEVNRFVKTAPQSDDLTMLAFCCKRTGCSENGEKIVLKNNLEEIPRLNGFVVHFAEKAGFDDAEVLDLKLALEEATANVIDYAYPSGTVAEIVVEACFDEAEIRFEIIDSGKAFDPTAVADADVSLDVDEREIGGLGIFLMRRIMDEVRYVRSDDRNHLTLIKRKKSKI